MKISTTFLVLLIVVLPQLAWSGTTGKISGKVVDAKTGEPLVGATVAIVNTKLGGTTDVNGSYFVIGITPGTYEVQVSYVGYQTVIEKGVDVYIDRTTPVNFKLSETAIQAKAVVVTAEQPRIIRDLTSTSEQVSAAQIQNLPVEGITDILQLQAGMTQDPGGGLHLRGGRTDEIQYIVDGIPVVDPFGNGLAVDVQNNDIQQLQVISGTFNAEYGQAMSGIVNIVTKDGSDKLEGNVEAYTGQYATTDPVLSADAGLPSSNLTKNTNLYYDINGQQPLGERYAQGELGGPVPLLGQTHFFISGRYADEQGWLFGKRIHNPEDGPVSNLSASNPADYLIVYTGDSALVPMNPSLNWSYSAKITTRPIENLKIAYSHTTDYSQNKYYDHFNMFNPGYDPTYKNWGYNNALILTHTISINTYQTLGLSYYSTKFSRSVYDDPYDPRYPEEIAWQLSIPTGVFNVGGVDNSFLYQKSFTRELKYDLTSQINDANLVKLGFDIRDIKMEYEYFTVNYSPNYPSFPFAITIDPTTDFDHDVYNHNPREGAAYIQDKLEVKDFVLNVGLRFDYFNARYYIPTDYGNPMNQTEPGKQPVPFDQAYRYVDPKTQLSPRVGVAFPISDIGSLHASFGEFFQMPDLQQVYTNPGFKVQGIWQSYIGNADINPEATTAYEIGLQQELTPQLVMDVTSYYKDIRNLSGVTFYETFNGISYAEYTNANYGDAWGITLELRLLRTGLLSSDLNYTYQVAEGNGSDPLQAFYDRQNGDESTRILVPLTWDQTHVLNWVLNLDGEDWGMSAISRFASGLPYSPNVLDFIATNPQLLNLARHLPQFNVDFEAYKNFRFGAFGAQVFLRVENLLGQTLQEYYPTLRPIDLITHAPYDYLNSLYSFDYDPGSQPMPRLVKLGVKINY